MPSGIYIRTEIAKKHMSESHKGLKHSQEWIEKVRKKMKGRMPKNIELLRTPEVNEKRRMAMKGRMPKNIALLRTPEIIAKAVLAKKGKIPKHFFRIQKLGWEANRGVPRTDIIREKISLGLRRLGRTGAKSSNWKGGITPEIIMIRQSIENRLWREAVFARDDWTCQKCKIRGGKLVAHHIQNFAQYPEVRFAIDNGITLCKECHIRFHKLYGRKNNTKEQLEEFLLSKTLAEQEKIIEIIHHD